MQSLWQKLKAVQTVTLRCEPWQGHAKVTVTAPDAHTLIFQERGGWEGKNLSFTNTLRWSFQSDSISLEHLRLGAPVQLVELTKVGENRLQSKVPHLCGQDSYSAEVIWKDGEIVLAWSVEGPKKNEMIYSHYK